MYQLPLFSQELTSPIADIHTSKRGANERRGVHAWHPYYAGYSEQFVADVINALAQPENVILDPWNGSGTTTLVAQRMNLSSIGTEINPAMTIHARAKCLRLVSEADNIRRICEQLLDSANSQLDKERNYSAGLRELVSKRALDALISIRDTIFSTLPTGSFPEFANRILQSEEPPHHTSNLQAFFLSAAFKVLREVGSFQRGSNPTWIKVGPQKTDISAEEIFKVYTKTVASMLYDLDVASGNAKSVADAIILNGDSRALPLLANSIDLVITSPPYCTRIDYAVSTKPELFLLGIVDDLFDDLRRATMGAPVIANKAIEPSVLWGPSCNQFLEEVSKHDSKAARSYYLPIYLQYFHDAWRSLGEIARVLKAGGQGAIVVQSSYFKDIELPLSSVYVELAQGLGLDARIGRREVIRQHMAHINQKSNGYVANKIYYEDVILIVKPQRGSTMPDRSVYSNHAEQREAALPPAERLQDLENALTQAFRGHIEYREVPFILFDQVGVEELADAFYHNPIMVKVILASVNVATRAVKRDLGIDLNTYASVIPERIALILAGYIKPMLPRELAVPALIMLDHYFWVDKEMRAEKGRWEQQITRYLNEYGNVKFKKRKFVHQSSQFELDAAYPSTGTSILIGIDIKRFESERDYHKRGDEITQKARHFKAAYPQSRFYAVIYYPFPSRHDNVRNRYANQGIDGIYFAGETSETIERVALTILEANNLLR